MSPIKSFTPNTFLVLRNFGYANRKWPVVKKIKVHSLETKKLQWEKKYYIDFLSNAFYYSSSIKIQNSNLASSEKRINLQWFWWVKINRFTRWNDRQDIRVVHVLFSIEGAKLLSRSFLLHSNKKSWVDFFDESQLFNAWAPCSCNTNYSDIHGALKAGVVWIMRKYSPTHIKFVFAQWLFFKWSFQAYLKSNS